MGLLGFWNGDEVGSLPLIWGLLCKRDFGVEGVVNFGKCER